MTKSILAMGLWMSMGMAAGQTEAAKVRISETDRMLSALLVLERAASESGVNSAGPSAALRVADGEKSKAAKILAKFRAEFEDLKVRGTGKQEPTDEQVREFYRARAKLLQDTWEKLGKELGAETWLEVGGVTKKHLTGRAAPVVKP